MNIARSILMTIGQVSHSTTLTRLSPDDPDDWEPAAEYRMQLSLPSDGLVIPRPLISTASVFRYPCTIKPSKVFLERGKVRVRLNKYVYGLPFL